jgi:hypothetical protein
VRRTTIEGSTLRIMAGSPSSPEQMAQGRHTDQRMIKAVRILNFFIEVVLLLNLETICS